MDIEKQGTDNYNNSSSNNNSNKTKRNGSQKETAILPVIPVHLLSLQTI